MKSNPVKIQLKKIPKREALENLRRITDGGDPDLIARCLALPMIKRTNFLRRKIGPWGGTSL